MKEKMINRIVIAFIMVLVCVLTIVITELHIQNWLERYEDETNAKIEQIVKINVENFNKEIEDETIDALPISEYEYKALLYDLMYE